MNNSDRLHFKSGKGTSNFQEIIIRLKSKIILIYSYPFIVANTDFGNRKGSCPR